MTEPQICRWKLKHLLVCLIEVFSERYTLFIEGEEGILYNATSPIGTNIVENLSSNSPVYIQFGNSFVTIESVFFDKPNTENDLYPFG